MHGNLSHRREPLRARLWAVAAVTAVWTAPAGAQVQMTDVTAAAGLEPTSFASTTDHSLGINWIDFDDDGWPDLFLVGGNPMRDCRLFRNLGDGTFADAGDLLPELPTVETSGSVFADYDRDGDLDVYVYTDNPVWDPVPAVNPDGGPANLLPRCCSSTRVPMARGWSLSSTSPSTSA